MRDELCVQGGILFKVDWGVIPTDLSDDIMRQIHASHLDIEALLRWAREYIYWSGMNGQLTAYMEQCEICEDYSDQQQKTQETLQHHEVSTQPWEKVRTDLFTVNNRNYMVTVDYYSNLWEVDYLTDTVIRKLKGHFARSSIPGTLCSDNRPQYIAAIFKWSSTNWELEYKTSSPKEDSR